MTNFLAQRGSFAFILSIKDIRPLTLPPPSLLPPTRICVIIFSPYSENIETILTPKRANFEGDTRFQNQN